MQFTQTRKATLTATVWANRHIGHAIVTIGQRHQATAIAATAATAVVAVVHPATAAVVSEVVVVALTVGK
ncbi:hypothetical protein N5J31_01890 [Acinetobacter johnsonii]|uniref:hypothetical protein n=1 Tax=Acinetobacter johnsonii TaxID=40214 RepID=UPI0024493B97|nr:hypothetical protein [Acinetobacter johnsonii]MDH2045679.1 hypothetical protein [Acinetobacter johnsonii]